MKKKCKHRWVNAVDGCLLCGKGWEQLNKEGYCFKAIKPHPLKEKE